MDFTEMDYMKWMLLVRYRKHGGGPLVEGSLKGAYEFLAYEGSCCLYM